MSKHRTSRAYDLTHELFVTQHVDASRTFTTVMVTDKDFSGIGVAKRNHEDPVRFEVGYELAYARALRDLADNLEKAVHTG